MQSTALHYVLRGLKHVTSDHLKAVSILVAFHLEFHTEEFRFYARLELAPVENTTVDSKSARSMCCLPNSQRLFLLTPSFEDLTAFSPSDQCIGCILT